MKSLLIKLILEYSPNTVLDPVLMEVISILIHFAIFWLVLFIIYMGKITAREPKLKDIRVMWSIHIRDFLIITKEPDFWRFVSGRPPKIIKKRYMPENYRNL